ncbi:MAG TPA: hypothetical protein VMS74_10060 [Acidimicrobiia bacterium]|nr:hypothetical protein [Acidimicrobiia bacterium]
MPHLRSDTTPYQFYRVAPPGVMLVTVPFDLAEYSLAAVDRELARLWERVDSLVERNVDRIVLAGVPVAAALGRDRTLEIAELITRRTGLPAGSDLESHVMAAHHLGVSTMAMATRWSDGVNEALRAYMAEAGIEVVSVASRPRDLEQNKAADPNEDHRLMLALGRRAVREPPALPDALFLPGGLGLVVDVAAILEEELQLPVFTNATSTLWAALRGHPGAVQTDGTTYPSRLLATLARSTQ